MAFFNITSDDEFKGATVILDDGSTHTIGHDNINYQTLVTGLLTGDLSDDQILKLVSPFELAYRTLTRLSERVSRKGNKLLFDGDVTDNSLTKHIIKIMNGGGSEDEWVAYVNFMEKLYTNPSAESRDHLFHFIEAHGLLLTPEGDIVLYKSTRADGRSTYAGRGIVDGVEYENDYLPNSVGAVVEIPRSMVDDNRGVACSTGLHLGSFGFANTYAERLWTAIVNPRDVVSVPSDHNDAKIRVARYQIVEENVDRVEYEGTVKAFDKPEAPAPVIPEVEVVTEKIEAPVSVPVKSANGSRVAEYETVIRALIKADPNANLKRYRSKKITAGRRDEFTQAAKNLGFKL